MKKTFGYIFYFSSFLFLTGTNFCLMAQDNGTTLNKETVDIAKLNPEDYFKLNLPPLSVFLDAAENCAKIGYLKATKEEEESSLLTTRREWMNSFRLVGNYQFGKLSATINGTTFGSGLDRPDQIYNGGVAISLPIDIIYDRKNRINKEQIRLKQINYQILEAVDLLKNDIADTYIAIIQQINTLKVRAESVVYSNSDIKMSETGYLNGNIQLADLNYRKSIQATAIASYEETRAQLNKAILHMELLTNIKILNK